MNTTERDERDGRAIWLTALALLILGFNVWAILIGVVGGCLACGLQAAREEAKQRKLKQHKP